MIIVRVEFDPDKRQSTIGNIFAIVAKNENPSANANNLVLHMEK